MEVLAEVDVLSIPTSSSVELYHKIIVWGRGDGMREQLWRTDLRKTEGSRWVESQHFSWYHRGPVGM